MSANLSVAETLAQLEDKVAYHAEQREHHATQEVFHAEQKQLHDAEHRSALERFEAFQAASARPPERSSGASSLLPRRRPRPLPSRPRRPRTFRPETRDG